MNKLLVVGLTSLVLFGLSGTASWYFQQQKQAEAHAPAAPPPAERPGPSSPPAREEPMRAALRPGFNAGSEEIARLTGELRSRLAAARENERQTAARKKELELIQHDLRGERASLDDLQKQIKRELEAVQTAVADLERKRGALQAEQGKTGQAAKELEAKSVRLMKEEQTNLKKMSLMYNTMPAEGAAKIMKALAESGKIETAVKVLGMMQERQAAKVLAEMSDPTLAVQLLERLKGLRTPPRETAASVNR
jgi:pentatricopeptide repeat protein